MSGTDSWVLITLLAVCAGLLLLLLLAVMRAGRGLARIAGLLEKRGGGGEGAASMLATRKSSHDGEFETFLKADPARRQLTKSEQFRAYRRWRQQQGLNWSKP
ncbi:MAG: hypothetical protein WCO57_08485 [Verrucomicrobiota bacterium]